MPKEDNTVLKYNYGGKSIKVPAIIFADLECLLEKVHSCQNNPGKSYTEKKLCISLVAIHCLQIVHLMQQNISFIEKEMILLTEEENKCYEEQKVCYICKKEFNTDKNDKNSFKLYHKIRDHCHYTRKFRGAAQSICDLKYKTSKEISVVFHNDSTYDYHFIIKQLAKEFDGQFECLGENTEKYITFSVPIKKELDNSKTITYKLKFIDSFRFMSTSLSSLVDNLSDGFHCNKFIVCKSSLDYMITRNDQLIFRCFECKKNYQKDFNKDLINRFANTYEFCNKDINRFILLLRKGIHPYEHIDIWERFDETSLPDKEAFYSNLNIVGITSVDYRHAKRVYEEFKLKNQGDYHDLYIKSDTLLRADVFENFKNKFIEIYNLILLIFCLQQD